MDLKVLRGLINTDTDCKYLLSQKIINTYSGQNIDYVTLEFAINSPKEDLLDYWVNECLGSTFKKEFLTEKNIIEYLKLKWTQVIILSKFLENLIKGFTIDFTKHSQYKLLKQNFNIPDQTKFKIFGIGKLLTTFITNSFIQYTVEARTDVDKNTMFEFAFIVPYQMAALKSRDNFSSFRAFALDQTNNYFKVETHIINLNTNETVWSFRDTTDLRTNTNLIFNELFANCVIAGLKNI